eukprot:4599796-Prymnesium_polylepis.1
MPTGSPSADLAMRGLVRCRRGRCGCVHLTPGEARWPTRHRPQVRRVTHTHTHTRRSHGLWPMMRPGALSDATRALRCRLARDTCR